MIREAILLVQEKVSPDCATGNGAMFKVGKWIVGRTVHLDDKRPPSEKERDDGFFCQKFIKVVQMFMKARPVGITEGKYHLVYKDENGYQNCVVSVNEEFSTMTFITIMQLNKRNINDYKVSNGDRRIEIGEMK